MSVDYLCSILEDVKHSITLDSDECLAIIAALKAGQAMRDSLGIVSYLTKNGGRSYRHAGVGDNELAITSIESWDAATRGDV